MNMVPYSFDTILALPPAPSLSTPGQVQGVHIAVPADIRDSLLSRLQSWFAGRTEISFIDAGISDKLGLGYIILEWLEHEIDPLFLAILRDEEVVTDYTTYVRKGATDDEYYENHF